LPSSLKGLENLGESGNLFALGDTMRCLVDGNKAGEAFFDSKKNLTLDVVTDS